jgi:hypothetical protein
MMILVHQSLFPHFPLYMLVKTINFQSTVKSKTRPLSRRGRGFTRLARLTQELAACFNTPQWVCGAYTPLRALLSSPEDSSIGYEPISSSLSKLDDLRGAQERALPCKHHRESHSKPTQASKTVPQRSSIEEVPILIVVHLLSIYRFEAAAVTIVKPIPLFSSSPRSSSEALQQTDQSEESIANAPSTNKVFQTYTQKCARSLSLPHECQTPCGARG